MEKQTILITEQVQVSVSLLQSYFKKSIFQVTQMC